MSWKEFEDDCPGCRPALLNAKTGERLPEDSPEMKAILRIWEKTTLAERQAFHRVTCLNSRDEDDLFVMKCIIEQFQNC